jgi:hypothetical protein
VYWLGTVVVSVSSCVTVSGVRVFDSLRFHKEVVITVHRKGVFM